MKFDLVFKMLFPSLRNRLAEWLHFFNHAHEEKDETMRTHYENPLVHKAFSALM